MQHVGPIFPIQAFDRNRNIKTRTFWHLSISQQSDSASSRRIRLATAKGSQCPPPSFWQDLKQFSCRQSRGCMQWHQRPPPRLKLACPRSSPCLQHLPVVCVLSTIWRHSLAENCGMTLPPVPPWVPSVPWFASARSPSPISAPLSRQSSWRTAPGERTAPVGSSLRVGGAAQPRVHHRDVTLGTVQRHLWCGQNLSQHQKNRDIRWYQMISVIFVWTYVLQRHNHSNDICWCVLIVGHGTTNMTLPAAHGTSPKKRSSNLMSSAKELKKSGRSERNIKEAAVLAVQPPTKPKTKTFKIFPLLIIPIN